MRALSLLIAIFFSACTVSDQGTPVNSTEGTGSSGGTAEVSEYRIVSTGAYGASASSTEGRRAPWVEVANDEQRYRDLWSRHVSPEAPPPVDFARESAIFLLLGPRSTGGYSIEVKGVEISGEEVIVAADLIEPEPGGITTMAFSAPYSVLAVRKRGVSKVDWNNRGRLLARHVPE